MGIVREHVEAEHAQQGFVRMRKHHLWRGRVRRRIELAATVPCVISYFMRAVARGASN